MMMCPMEDHNNNSDDYHNNDDGDERRNGGSTSPRVEPSTPTDNNNSGVDGIGGRDTSSAEQNAEAEREGRDAVRPRPQRPRAASPSQAVPPPPRRFDAEKVLRCDIAKGLMRCSGEAVELDDGLDAPPFVVPFEMLEPTTIPKLLLDAIWVLTNIKSCTEKGEGGAYITGLPGLHVTLDKNNAHKSVIRRMLADGSKMQLNEISLQIRVQEVSARLVPLRRKEEEEEEEEQAAGQVEEEGGDRRGGGRRAEVIRERFLLLVARSPLAFSLRKAAYTATRSVGRLTVHDSRGADERRRVWAQLAMHVRGPLQPYMTGADLMEMFEPSMDWMRSGEADGFSCLFSMQRAVDWMKARFIAKYEGQYLFGSHLTVHGLIGGMTLPGAAGDDEESRGGAADDADDDEDDDNDNDNDADGAGGRRRARRRVSGEEEEEAASAVEDYLVTPRFVDACRQYDEDVDREVERTYQSDHDKQKPKKRKPPAGRGRGGRGSSSRRGRGAGRGGALRSDQDEQQELEEEEDDHHVGGGGGGEPERAMVRAYGGLELRPLPEGEGEQEDDDEPGGGGGGRRRRRRGGIPEAVVAMRVVLRTSMEAPMRLAELRQHMRTFPESVMLELLRGQLQLPADLLTHMHRRMRERTLEVSACDMRDIVMGDGEYNLGRPMLAHGDAAWGKQMMETIREVDGGEARLHTMIKFMQIGFALSYTRAKGSDSYTNGRVAAYGRYMTFENGELSRDECREMYAHMRLAYFLNAGGEEEEEEEETDRASVDGSSMIRGLQYAMDKVLECDSCMWNLRPDNLHLFMQLMVSDLMLCLNYHGSVIDGASNGIRATVVIRDGGGSFRQWFKDVSSGGLMLGQVMSKGNGTGADHCVSAYKKIVNVGVYDERFKMQREFITEMKRATETSLIQETCNTIEWRGSTPLIKHLIEETDTRKYSTELKAGADQQSLNNMQAISWLIPRNTVAMDCNCFTTTREDADSKERIRVEYRQVTNGYLALCSNVVREGARERFHTVLAVTRTVGSSAAGVEMDDVMKGGESEERFVEGLHSEERHTAQNGRVDRAVVSGKEIELHKAARSVFFVGMGTAVCTAFIQWTGMLERVRETRLAEAVLSTFYAQLELCQDLLNPDMANSGDKMRFLQVSKARGVAMGLFAISMRETLEIGRCMYAQQAAVEQAALALKLEGGSAMVPWVIADTLEHMFRLDFFLVMGMLGRLLRVPCVELGELLAWLDSGRAKDCPAAEDFFQRHRTAVNGSEEQRRAWEVAGLGFAETGIMDSDARGLMPSRHCLYLTAPMLRVSLKVNANTTEGRKLFCEALGARLRREFSDTLQNGCRIEDNEEGDEIVRAMFACTVNKTFAWPSVLGEASVLRDFWKGRAPPAPSAAVLRNNPSLQRDLARLALPPLRMLGVENTVATLGVDLRWLLLVGALCEGQLSQSSRFSAVGQLVQRFYHHCVPNHLVPSNKLFIGLPSQVTGAGFVWPEVLPSARRVLRRPGRRVGMDAPCPTGMVEDMGAAAPRFEIAHMLGVNERDMPTESVHYELPHGIWMPALLGKDEQTPGGVLWEKGRLFVWGEGMAERRDVTLEVLEEDAMEPHEVYLAGRSKEKVRPTPAFYRPGVVVAERAEGPTEVVGDGAAGAAVLPGDVRLGVVGAFDPRDGRYGIVWQAVVGTGAGGRIIGQRLTPYEVQERVLPPDAPLRCKVRRIREPRVELQRADGTVRVFENQSGSHHHDRRHNNNNHNNNSNHRDHMAQAEEEVEEEEEEDEAEAMCFLDYQGAGDETLEQGCIGVRMPRITGMAPPLRNNQQQHRHHHHHQNNNDNSLDDEEDGPEGEGGGPIMVDTSSSSPMPIYGLFGASHGGRTRQDYEDRYAPRIRVHIEGVTMDSGEPAPHRAGYFVRCRQLVR